jgi:4-hydroxy-3-polyprenylbenzoate decarboxylase
MAPIDLRAFIRLLEEHGHLCRIKVCVDPHLELATVIDRTVKLQGGGPGLLFEQVRGTKLPVAANLLGSPERLSLALATCGLSALSERLATDLAATGQKAPREALAAVLDTLVPRTVATLPPLWRGNGDDVLTLEDLPAVTAWPGDGGPYLTMAQVFSRDPASAELNCGMYRVQLHGPREATVRFRPGSDGGRHLAAWHARKQAMPVALVLGGPPVLAWAAGAPLPAGISEVDFSSYLVGEPIAMSACQTCDLSVPSLAEIVIEGEIAPGARHRDGPFGNHTGSYDVEAFAPVLRVLAVHRRPEAIFPWTLVGPPPQENIAMARAAAMLLLPLLQLTVPSVRQLHMPNEGIFHRVAFITLESGDDRPLAVIAEQLWGADLLKGARMLVLGAEDQEAQDPSAVFWRALNRVDWQRDLLIADERLAVDARRVRGTSVQSDPQVVAQVLSRWGEYGITISH